MHDSRAIANEILDIARSDGISLTPMQLLKLVFFAHGWHYGLRGGPLTKHDFYAWQYGPVVREVYWAFSGFGRAPITEYATDEYGLPYRADLDVYQRRLLRSVVRAYGRKNAFTLSNMTHEPGTPWSQTYKAGQRARILQKTIRSYFEALVDRSRTRNEQQRGRRS